ncbi:hypothetical protein BX600DRAFT_511478 [Xylariales sp. PMI_506]|nr:hypothetical protein BX600DRAFT_511478 [Xylariales sp. PMI_506]
MYVINRAWAGCYTACAELLLVAGIIAVLVESLTIAPDTLGYVSTVVRNSRYLHVKPTSGAMTGPERARRLGETKVMMQDVKADHPQVGKIALGLKTDQAVKLSLNRLYR